MQIVYKNSKCFIRTRNTINTVFATRIPGVSSIPAIHLFLISKYPVIRENTARDKICQLPRSGLATSFTCKYKIDCVNFSCTSIVKNIAHNYIELLQPSLIRQFRLPFDTVQSKFMSVSALCFTDSKVH